MKTKRLFVSLIAGAAMLANIALPCAASSLSRAELREKYARALEMGDRYTENGGWVDVDENGIGEDGVDYGIEFAGKTLSICNDYSFTLKWNAATTYYHGDYKEYNGVYYAVKPDQTIKLVGYNEQYFKELKPEKLELPAEIDGMPVNEIDCEAFQYLGDRLIDGALKEIVVPDSITIIRCEAFYHAISNRSDEGVKINIPANVEYLGSHCYSGLFFALGEEVVLPETLEFYAPLAFYGTYTKVVLPESDFVSTGPFYYSNSPVPLMDNGLGGDSASTLRYFIRGQFGDNCIWPYPTEQVERYLSLGYDMDEIKEMLILPSEDPTPSETLQAQVPETAPTIEPEQTMLPGDLDANGEVNVIDAVAMARLVGDDPELELSEAGLSSSDYNGDGVTDALDLNDLMKYLAG